MLAVIDSMQPMQRDTLGTSDRLTTDTQARNQGVSDTLSETLKGDCCRQKCSKPTSTPVGSERDRTTINCALPQAEVEQSSDKGAASRLTDPPGSWQLAAREGPGDRQNLEKEGLSSQMTEQCVVQCTEVQANTLRGASPLPYPNGARVSAEDSLHSAVELELGLQGYADSPWPHKPAHNQTSDAEVGTTLGTNLALTWRRWRRIHFDQTWVTQTGLSGQRSIRQKQMEIAVRTWRRTISSEEKRAVDEAWHHQSNFYLWEQRKMKVAMEKMSLARLIEDSCKRRNVWNYGAMQHGERGAVRVQKVSRVMHFIKWLNAHRTGEGERQKVRYMQSYRKHNAVKVHSQVLYCQ